MKTLFYFAVILALIAPAIAEKSAVVNPTSSQSTTMVRRVNVPYLGVAPPVDLFTPAIFWFGSVDNSNNYADVRAYYYDAYIQFVVHIIDRRLWYDTSPTAPEMPDWDSISLYLNLDLNLDDAPSPKAYRFEVQLYNDFKAQYKGNNSGWTPASIPITSYSEWRGLAGPNSNTDEEGWVAYFQIPFTSLGLSASPAQGTFWSLGLVMHDRDDAAGLIKSDKRWPESINPIIPSTWGELRFGLPSYSTPMVIPEDLGNNPPGIERSNRG